ncbi:hypothetical protein OQA88_7464 [Cercophora sp. LCS_1]
MFIPALLLPIWVLLLAWTVWVGADFALYRVYDAEALIAGLALSSTCLAALNATIQCNETAVHLLSGGADIHFWTLPEVSNLCTSTCISSLNSWQSNVETVCDEETTIQAGVIVKAKALPMSFTYNVGLVCMKDTEDNWCFLESQTWQGSDYIRWDPDMCFTDGEDDSTVAPECADPDFNLEGISEDMAAMTNLYSDELYCSECFLHLYKHRLTNPWLPDGSFTEYLIDQFDSIQQNCTTTLAYTTYTSTLYVGRATPTTTTSAIASSASGTATYTPTPTCPGQVVEPIENWLTCDDLSDTYGVSTGDARVYTGDYDCYFNVDVCLPLPCELDIVWDEPSCETLTERYSNLTHPVTLNQFLSWNPNIQGSCHGVAPGQRICKSAPGGTFVPPTTTIHAPGATGTPTYYTSATPAHPTQAGTISECGEFYLVVAGDDCSTVILRFGLNFTQLQTYNTYLNIGCTNLWLDYDICVAPVTPPSISLDGACGPAWTCVGSTFGDCCSEYGFCGSGPEYCGSDPPPDVSVDGSCGPENGDTTCPGTSVYLPAATDVPLQMYPMHNLLPPGVAIALDRELLEARKCTARGGPAFRDVLMAQLHRTGLRGLLYWVSDPWEENGVMGDGLANFIKLHRAARFFSTGEALPGAMERLIRRLCDESIVTAYCLRLPVEMCYEASPGRFLYDIEN